MEINRRSLQTLTNSSLNWRWKDNNFFLGMIILCLTCYVGPMQFSVVLPFSNWWEVIGAHFRVENISFSQNPIMLHCWVPVSFVLLCYSPGSRFYFAAKYIKSEKHFILLNKQSFSWNLPHSADSSVLHISCFENYIIALLMRLSNNETFVI